MFRVKTLDPTLIVSYPTWCAVFADGVVVGGVCCRIEPSESPGGHDRLYIMTLGVLATWRRRGIGSKLLSHVLANLEQHPSVGEVYLHVQTSNEEAVHFYKVGIQYTPLVHEAPCIRNQTTGRTTSCRSRMRHWK